MDVTSSPRAWRDGLARTPALDGLRAIAILAVVAYHALPRLAPGGFVGVDVFFVLSGYLISRLLLRDAHAEPHLRLFYARRVRRLLPPLAITLVAVLLVAAVTRTDLVRRGLLAQSVMASAAF